MDNKKPTPSTTSRSNVSAQSTSGKGQACDSRKSNNLDNFGAKSTKPKKNRQTNVVANNSVEPSASGRQNQKHSGFKPIPNSNSNQNHYNRGSRGGGGAFGGARHHHDLHKPSLSSSSTSSSGLGYTDEGIAAELNSVYLPGSKKHNLNHLLNFNYAPRSANNATSGIGHHPGRAGVGRRQYTKYNKEQFLQANCQFVVRSDVDLQPYKITPDQIVEWTFIEQIHVQSAEEPQCPICLYHPVAGKMTRCGHVYCWPCVLHYLALSDKTWRKCPICYEAIHAADLKSAISKSYVNYNVGDYVDLQLMCRPKESLQVFKVTKLTDTKEYYPHLFCSEEEQVYSKLILADPSEILSIIGRERNELMCQLSSDGPDCPESMFIQQALDLLQERQLQCENMSAQFNETQLFHPKPTMDTSVHEAPAILGNTLRVSAQDFVPRSVGIDDTSSEVNATDNNNFVIDEDSQLMLQDIEIRPAVADAKNYYFYQAADGQHLYMHSVNIRMLQVQWGSLEMAPLVIRGKILQKESCSMTEVLRKRLKYLQHLPVASQFEVVEIGLHENAVSNSVKDMFKDELSSRQKGRQRRAKEEQKREKHIDEVNDRQIGKIRERSSNIDVTSTQLFPMYSNWDVSPSSYDAVSDHSNPPLVETNTAAETTTKKNRETIGPVASSSFARMLTTPEPSEVWPTLALVNTTASFPELASGSKNVAAIFGGVSSPRRRNTNSTSESERIIEDSAVESENDDEARAPEFRPDYGTAIANALNQQAILNAVGGKRKNKGGQKKKKNTVLFSTNVRAYNGN